MRHLAPIFAFLLASGCDESASNRGAASDQVAVEAVRAANAAKDEAMIARDARRLASFYTDDYRIIDQEAKVHDKRDQVQFMTQKVELLKAVSDDVQVTMLSPDAALLTGRMAGRYRMDNKEADFVERYTGVWLRQGKDWRVKHEHGSTEPAPD
jgi:ketosteroid isomerase-like protein